jgi:hypothetical protein
MVFLSDMGACLLHLRSYQGRLLRLFEYCKPRSPCYSTASDARFAPIFPVVSFFVALIESVVALGGCAST